jgi:hypothetical protein
MLRKETQDETFSDDGREFQPIVYSEDELEAMRKVKAKLIEDGIEESRIGASFLAVATINCKLRVEETAKKIKTLLELMEKLDCADGIPDDIWKPEAAHEMKAYAPCGKDFNGASTIWIVGGRKVEKEEQRHHVHASLMHFMAVHADAISLREGITFVIDVSKSAPPPKVGNEGTMQSFYQAFPQRPQAILIAGTNIITRVIVNASIKFASLFTKQKVLDRIKFVTVEQAKNSIPLASAPKYVGGEGGAVESLEQWVKERLENFPTPEL